jgi:hypothetical protein
MSAKTSETHHYILPRIIRIRDAPFYLGMDKNRFNAEVRPSLTEIKIGTQGIAFDRLELDAWVDELKTRIGKPGTKKLEKELWQRNPRGSQKGMVSGTLTKSSKEKDFMKALDQATSKKRSAT